tara:strand:- start:966 stop:2273 length:1308 start_codon:yes stop_codon:yes gene_type:complete
MKTLFKYGAYALLPALAGALPAWAAGDADTAALEQRIKALEEQLLSGADKPADKDAVKATTNGRSLTFTGEDFSFQVGGRMQLDAATYDASKEDNAFGDGTDVRRAYLELRGSMYENWSYRLQYDFARNSGPDRSARGIRDAWIKYDGFGPAITVGQFKEPFGLEGSASNLNLTFIERSLTNVFYANRRIGVGVSDAYPNWTYAIGAFGDEAGNENVQEADEVWEAAGRLTYAPLNVEGRVIHLGASARHQEQKDDSRNTLRFRERPESNVTNVRLIDTGQIEGVDDAQYFGLEAAAVVGPFSLQSEWMETQVGRENGADDVDFNAWYTYAGFFLTGESRPYKYGVFDRLKPKSTVGEGGIGAWEVALRYSTADLTNGPIIGGEEDNFTLGLNWYATQNVKFQANYIKVLELDRPDSQYDDEDLDSFVLRAQVDF